MSSSVFSVCKGFGYVCYMLIVVSCNACLYDVFYRFHASSHITDMLLYFSNRIIICACVMFFAMWMSGSIIKMSKGCS